LESEFESSLAYFKLNANPTGAFLSFLLAGWLVDDGACPQPSKNKVRATASSRNRIAFVMQ
jgi:hypothetical protein